MVRKLFSSIRDKVGLYRLVCSLQNPIMLVLVDGPLSFDWSALTSYDMTRTSRIPLLLCIYNYIIYIHNIIINNIVNVWIDYFARDIHNIT